MGMKIPLRTIAICCILLLVALMASAPARGAQASERPPAGIQSSAPDQSTTEATAATGQVASIIILPYNLDDDWAFAGGSPVTMLVIVTTSNPGVTTVPDGIPITFTLKDLQDPTNPLSPWGASITPNPAFTSRNGIEVAFDPPNASYWTDSAHSSRSIVRGAYSTAINITATAEGVQGSYALSILNPAPPALVACNPGNHTQYTPLGTQFNLKVLSMQTGKSTYSPGDTVVISGLLELAMRFQEVDQNCPKPYPNYYDDWMNFTPPTVFEGTNVTALGQSFPILKEDGAFNGSITLPSNLPLGNYTLQVTVTSTPSSVYNSTGSVNETPTTTTIPLTLFIQPSASSASTTENTSESYPECTTDNTPTSQQSSSGSSGCLIATATFGALSPEVQLLRPFRDTQILQTFAGRSFILAFNAWYYSFSPAIAEFITQHSGFRPLYGLFTSRS